MSKALEALAKRMQNHPFFLASLLATYARSENLDDDGVAQALGCSLDDLVLVCLCRAPREEAPGFRADIANIAERFHLDATQLAHVVRRAQVLQRLEPGTPSAVSGMLMAARDREEKPPREEQS